MAGVMVLGPDSVRPSPAEISVTLERLGFRPWLGDGDPDFVVFHSTGPKGDWFEAGFWGGRGVPVFFLGGGAKAYKRKQLVGRFGGWSVVGQDNKATLAELVDAIQRRGLMPAVEAT